MQEASHTRLLQTIPEDSYERESQENSHIHTRADSPSSLEKKTATLCLFPFFRCSPLSLSLSAVYLSRRLPKSRGVERRGEPISPVLVLSCAFRAPLQRSRHLPRTPLAHGKTWSQIPDSGFLIVTGPCSLWNTNLYSSYFICIICHPILRSL